MSVVSKGRLISLAGPSCDWGCPGSPGMCQIVLPICSAAVSNMWAAVGCNYQDVMIMARAKSGRLVSFGTFCGKGETFKMPRRTPLKAARAEAG